MKRIGVAGLAVAAGVIFCSAHAEAQGDERAGVEVDQATVTAAGFETWLVQQCPDGAIVRLENRATDEPIGAVSCESLRPRMLADGPTREALVAAYQSQTRDAQGDAQGGALGEARQPLLFGAVVCAVMAAAPGLLFGWPGNGCARAAHPADRRKCENVIGGWSVASGLACTIGFLF